ncbi:ent-kaurene oxidase [Lecanosticta acicola]|uniref:Ent-kaurene oxidase n=1 Tax=Lecanosticta acicola TaxID=111012 RepID=A0AAI9EBN1_9PEZI|nr:ent-kaurene oxidase [Lecanosticta acicola]
MGHYLHAIWQRPETPLWLAAALFVVGFTAIYRLLFSDRSLPDLAIVGAKPNEWFPLQRARWRNTVDMKTATVQAYESRDRACIFPIGASQVLVHLPHKELQWLAERPDSDVNVLAQIIDMLQLDYTVMDPGLVHRPSHIPLIAGALTRETGNLVPELLDEIEHSVSEAWGTDTQAFKEIAVYPSMTKVVGQTTNRAFVGLPYCRDPALLEAAISFAQGIPVAAALLHSLPAPLRPLLAPFITLPNRINTNRFFRILRSDIKQRQARLSSQPTGTAEKGRNDFLEWSVKQAQTLDDPYFGKPDTLAGRILIVNFTSIHTTSFAITHAILDLAAGKQEYIDELREEITSCLAAHGGRWDKRSLADMTKLDSVLRESQRINSFATTSINRMVVNPAGITTPSGVHIKPGVMVCAPAYPVFHDPAIYSHADEFKPFRFAEQRAAVAQEGASATQKARTAFTTASPDYTNFGYGKHACPGRFFAATALRLTLAYMVMNYDFELQDKRAENSWFAMNRIPPVSATIRLRRRVVR